MSRYDLAVAYRIYPGVSKKPFVHSDNKLELAELGVKSFKHSLADLKVKAHFLLDNCGKEYEEMILRHFNAEDIVFIHFNGIGNLPTFGEQMNILLNQTDSEYVFFVEDDYVFLPGSTASALKFLQRPDIHFVTLYDHIDSYEMEIHTRHAYEVIIGNEHHWRTSASTCMTFMAKKQTLKKTEKLFRSYCKRNWDSSLWFALTKFNVFRPDSLIYLFTNKMLFKAIVLSWAKTGFYILFGKKYKLWQPVPSLATHMEITGLAPVVDWNKVVTQYESSTSR